MANLVEHFGVFVTSTLSSFVLVVDKLVVMGCFVSGLMLVRAG
jgi:hypothetical protein